MQAATKRSREANNKAPRPEIHRYPAAEAPCRLCLAPPATPPPPGASPPPRGRWHWQLPRATEFGLGQPIRQRHFSLKWRKESQPKPVGIERSSPDGHRPQRPWAIVRLHVHLRLGREKQLDHLREAVACRRVQRGPASVRSPACGCASGHLPYKARYQVVGVDVCYKAFFIRCMFDRIGQSPHLRSLYQVYHSHADITNRIC